MTDTASKHLRRLSNVWVKAPIYFVTTCTAQRRPILASAPAHAVLLAECSDMQRRHGWMIGRYIIMPDHVHFFASPLQTAAKQLSYAVGKWKEWTSKALVRTQQATAPVWQPEFFDHVLRSEESWRAKWNYMHENPVRAGLVNDPQDWPYTGAVDFE